MRKVEHSECTGALMHIRDAMDVISGKWKLQIIISISSGNHRFTQIEKSIPKLSSKVLSKELKDLEEHKLIERIVHDQTPVLVEYKLLPHTRSLDKVIKTLRDWGIEHRKEVMGK